MKKCLIGLALAAGLTTGAAAQTIGPDVIVSTIGSTFTKYGTFNAGTVDSPKLITGYAVTTVSCNIGDALAIWIDSTNTSDPNRNKHPVIGTQMYRLWNGRFEMIGMSWLKHGFCAADAPNCLTLAHPGATNVVYAPNSSCDWLGYYATDTYSASLNGQQSNCGPRSEVNATTGEFPYPYVLGWGATGNCVNKRLQIANADLDPALYPGARFFCEVHYITTDERTTSNPAGDFLPEQAFIRGNNASYREVLVGSRSGITASGCLATDTGFNLAFSGNTIAKVPAIQAWKTIDPSVTLIPVDIPGDGRVIIGYKVTDLGNGRWNYEYAIYNHNSHKSIGSFSLPKKDATVVATDVGFHDVDYHSGEPYSNADWTLTATDGRLSWATQSFAQNPNANAIRWSSLYNFRFTANSAPSTGSISLGLFRPETGGQPGVVVVPGVAVPIDHCMADYDGVNGVGVQDLFSFLQDYFANSPSADLDSIPGVSVEDVYFFLGAWFRGC
jgi:opacity protein-like surface antigen